VSKSFFKHLEKLKSSEEYAEALGNGGVLLVRHHHKKLFDLFLNHTTGDAASCLRTAKTARESFQVWFEPTLTLRVQKQTFELHR
jgi:hypothetical protein